MWRKNGNHKNYLGRLSDYRLKKAAKIYGEFEDADKYFRCINCGFICNKERDDLRKVLNGTGLGYVSYSDTIYESPLGNGHAILGDIIEHYQTSMQLDSSGEPLGLDEHFEPENTGGCPLCGSLNWLG